MTSSRVESLISRYISSAEVHGLASAAGDHASANRAAVELAETYKAIRGHGRGAQDAFLALLDHPSTWVRVWAAAYALEFDVKRAESTLVALSEAPGLAGLSAATTLREWRRGHLRFP